MFRHTKSSDNETVEKKLETENKKSPISEIANVKEASKVDTQVLKDLLEKNLKWSQIIYEQNRKINNKLMWSSLGGWLRLFLILAPLIWAAWFLPPLINQFMKNYGDLLGGKSNAVQSGSLEQIMKFLPLGPAEQEQIKALLK